MSAAMGVIREFFVAMLTILLILLLKFILKLKKSRDTGILLSKSIGCPTKHWLFGHLKEFAGSESGLLNSAKRAITFPMMSMMWFGPTEAAVECYHPDSVKPILTKEVPKATFAYKFLQPWLGKSILLSAGKDWTIKRKLISPAFNAKAVEKYMGVFNEVTDTMLNKFPVGDKSFDVYHKVNLMTLDAMLQCCFSHNMYPQEERRETMKFVDAINNLDDMIIKRIVAVHLWNDTVFRYSNLGKKFFDACEIVHTLSEMIIRRRLAHRTAADRNGCKEYDDFLEKLLQGKDVLGDELSITDIRNEVDTFLFAGHHTTASALSWTIYNLAKHTRCQEICAEEVIDTIHESVVIKWSDLEKLQYVKQCIMEAMRLFPPITGVGRCPAKPFEVICPYDAKSKLTIPETTTMNVRIFDLHRHPSVWENPEDFIPERFAKDKTNQIPKFSYIPFSAGHRNCIGHIFAMTLLTVAVSKILLKFELYLDKNLPDPEMKCGVTLTSTNGFLIKLRHRQTS